VFVLDLSGSMSTPGKIDLARVAFEALVKRLRPQDSIAVVTFADAARVLLQPTPVANADRTAMVRAVNALRPRGHSDLSGGMELYLESFEVEGNEQDQD
jgi:Ca-activated chloride channel family protein